MWRLFNSRVQYENKVKGVINLYVKKLILDFLVNNNISINDAEKSNSIGIMISSVKTIISLLCECDDKNIEMKCNISNFIIGSKMRLKEIIFTTMTCIYY